MWQSMACDRCCATAMITDLMAEHKGAVVIISHDRYLLDLVVDEIAELEAGKLNVYPGTYSEYAFEKQNKGKVWKNLTKEKAALLSSYYSHWDDLLRSTEKTAREHVRERYTRYRPA